MLAIVIIAVDVWWVLSGRSKPSVCSGCVAWAVRQLSTVAKYYAHSDGFDTKNWEIYAMIQTPYTGPPRTCFDVYEQNPAAKNGVYNLVMADMKTKWSAYCDISGGGWTRIYANDFTKNHAGVKYNIDCPCGVNAGMNNGAKAIDANGWHLGVTNCHNSNKLSGNIGGATVKYSWRMDFAILNYGPASAIRHTGINQNDHGYDHKNSWPAGASAITSNVHKNDGEMTSAYKDANGKWQWFARYNLGSFDIKSNKPATAPYFTFMYVARRAYVACTRGVHL